MASKAAEHEEIIEEQAAAAAAAGDGAKGAGAVKAKKLPKVISLKEAEKLKPPGAAWHEDPTMSRLRIFYGKQRKSTGLTFDASSTASITAAIVHCLRFAWAKHNEATNADIPYVFPDP